MMRSFVRGILQMAAESEPEAVPPILAIAEASTRHGPLVPPPPAWLEWAIQGAADGGPVPPGLVWALAWTRTEGHPLHGIHRDPPVDLWGLRLLSSHEIEKICDGTPGEKAALVAQHARRAVDVLKPRQEEGEEDTESWVDVLLRVAHDPEEAWAILWHWLAIDTLPRAQFGGLTGAVR